MRSGPLRWRSLFLHLAWPEFMRAQFPEIHGGNNLWIEATKENHSSVGTMNFNSAAPRVFARKAQQRTAFCSIIIPSLNPPNAVAHARYPDLPK